MNASIGMVRSLVLPACLALLSGACSGGERRDGSCQPVSCNASGQLTRISYTPESARFDRATHTVRVTGLLQTSPWVRCPAGRYIAVSHTFSAAGEVLDRRAPLGDATPLSAVEHAERVEQAGEPAVVVEAEALGRRFQLRGSDSTFHGQSGDLGCATVEVDLGAGWTRYVELSCGYCEVPCNPCL